MSRIYTTTYEIIGDGIAIADRHYAEFDEARQAQWDYAERIGGVGMRPDHSGGIGSIFFREVPTGWRRCGKQGDKVEARPNKSTKAGKAALAQIAELPRSPRPEALAALFGYAPSEMALDPHRGVIYFPTEMRLSFPTQRMFLRLPRFEGDGFTPDEALLRALPESELMKAVEEHNAEARRLREKEAA